MRFQSLYHRPLLWFFLVGLFHWCPIQGCVLKQEDQVLVRETKLPDAERSSPRADGERNHDVDLRAWRAGEIAFEKGQYEKAARIFRELQEEADSEALRRKNLYALACTYLVQSSDVQSYRKALELWDRWRQTAPGGTDGEDPRMMTPLLKRLSQPLQDREDEIQRLRQQLETLEEIHRRIDYAVWRYWREFSPTDLLDEDPLLVAPRLEQVPLLLHRQQDEIQRLRHQIEALEEIDRTIEEKKRGATSN